MVHQAEPRRGASWLTRARAASSSFSAGEHLTSEAVVAFVDGELRMGAHQRAAAHVSLCVECADDVAAQRQARSAVRSAAPVCVPAGLMGALRGIPERADDAPAPALLGSTPGAPLACGLLAGSVVRDSTGAWVTVLRPEAFGTGREQT